MSTPQHSNYTLVIPTRDDFEALSEMKDIAFAEKRGCVSAQTSQAHLKKCYQKYADHHPAKLEHCRIVKEASTGRVLGGCQLQLFGDPADLSLDSSMQHTILPGEAYIEWIATDPDHTGRGLGSKLLAWAFETCQKASTIDRLSLEVMTANQGALRLYERKGFVVMSDPHTGFLDQLFTPCFVFCCFGCKYCSVKYMEKPINAGDYRSDGAVVPTPEMTR